MSNKLSISDVAGLISNKSGLTKKECESLLKDVFQLASEVVSAGEPLTIKGIGSFKFIWVESRGSVDINTGASITIPGHYKLSFVPEASLRNAVNEPFAYFATEMLPPKSEQAESSVMEKAKEEKKMLTDKTENEDVPVSEVPKDADKGVPVSAEAGTTAEETAGSEISVSVHYEKDDAVAADGQGKTEPVSAESGTTAEETAEKEAAAGVSAVNQGDDNINNREETEVYDLADVKENDALPQQTEKAGEVADTEISSPGKDSDEQALSPDEKIAVSENEENEGRSKHIPQKDIEKEYRRRTRNGYIAGFATAFLLFLIIGGLTYYFYFGFKNIDFTLSVFKIPFTTTEEEKAEPNKTDSAVVTKEAIVQEPQEEIVSEYAPDTEKVIETIEPGKFLTTIALKHYGNKIFWVYIYRENEDRIWNPRYLPKGFKVVVPPPSKYSIDSKDESSIKRAQDLEKQILYEIE